MRSLARSTLPAAFAAAIALASCGTTDNDPGVAPTEFVDSGTTTTTTTEVIDPWTSQVDSIPTTEVAEPESSTTSAEPEADPLAEIEKIESAFDAAYGDSYSYVVSYQTERRDSPNCDLSAARIVVVDGAVTDAVALPNPLRDACRIDVAAALTAADVFDLARSLSETSDVSVWAGPTGEASMQLKAVDGDVETLLRIGLAWESTAPTSVGWDEVGPDAAAARQRWSEQSFDHVVTIEEYSFARQSQRVTTVIGGQPVTVVEYGDLANDEAGEEVDPAEWAERGIPLTVDDALDIIDNEERTGYIAAVFDTDTGAPIAVWADIYPDAVDDEFEAFATVERL